VNRVLAVLLLVVTASIHADVTIPTRVQFEGELKTSEGAPRAAPVTMVISLYESKDASAALWSEVQNVRPDQDGRYAISIGATLEEGIPAGIFASGHARWIGVAVQGEAEQPRVMLLSVPYAAKAREAETVGGKSVSDFVLVENLKEQMRAVMSGADAAMQPSGGRIVMQGRALPPLSRIQPDFTGTAAGDFYHQALSGITNGVVGRARSTTSGTLLTAVTGVLGEINAAPTGLYSAAVRGIHYSTTGNGIGVVGYQDGAGWGVYGQTPQGIGVYGRVIGGDSFGGGVLGESLGAAPGVHASYSGSGAGVALQIENGAIQVSGTARAAFVQTAVEGNLTLDSTVIDNPLCNGDPNAILIVTARHNPAAPFVYNTDVFVRYWTAAARWEIVMPGVTSSSYINAQFNVLVIKQ